jgi:hypothetical protein
VGDGLGAAGARLFVDLVALMEVDGTPDVAFEAGLPSMSIRVLSA